MSFLPSIENTHPRVASFIPGWMTWDNEMSVCCPLLDRIAMASGGTLCELFSDVPMGGEPELLVCGLAVFFSTIANKCFFDTSADVSKKTKKPRSLRSAAHIKHFPSCDCKLGKR